MPSPSAFSPLIRCPKCGKWNHQLCPNCSRSPVKKLEDVLLPVLDDWKNIPEIRSSLPAVYTEESIRRLLKRYLAEDRIIRRKQPYGKTFRYVYKKV